MDSLRKSVCRGLLEQTLQPIFLRTISAKDHLTLTGVSSVFITHYPDHALELADDALLLGKGKAPVFGRASDVLTEESLSEAFGIQVRIRDVQIPEGIRKTVIAAE